MTASHSHMVVQQAGAPLLRLSGVRKAYPGVQALKGLDLDIAAGEVIGLVGENGAGKSTLMKILGGVTAPDAGVIEIDGSPHAALSVAASMRAGIAFVHQELNLFDNLDVAANVFIGREPRKFGLLNIVDVERQRAAVTPILARLGATFSADTPVRDLSLAQQQLVEIAKALSVHARLVILDEPTSSLPAAETERLLGVIEGLRRDGIAVVFISHRLAEVERVADRVIVLRDGALVGRLERADVTHDAMVRLMIGRPLKAAYVEPARAPGETVLSIEGLRTAAWPDRQVSLDLRAGEIVGLAGLVGSGRTEMARALFGIDRAYGGTIRMAGQAVVLSTSAAAVARGIALVPEDRKATGILLDLPIAQNISLPDLGACSRAMLVSAVEETARAEKGRRDLGIRTPSVATRTGSLSGGNQQKVVLAKWLAMNPRVIILDEPTRGIDVGAKAEIYRLMRALADAGVAVLMISSDMEEVIGVSDRIAVMHEGRISGMLERSRFSEENVLRLAVGGEIA